MDIENNTKVIKIVHPFLCEIENSCRLDGMYLCVCVSNKNGGVLCEYQETRRNGNDDDAQVCCVLECCRRERERGL